MKLDLQYFAEEASAQVKKTENELAQIKMQAVVHKIFAESDITATKEITQLHNKDPE